MKAFCYRNDGYSPTRKKIAAVMPVPLSKHQSSLFCLLTQSSRRAFLSARLLQMQNKRSAPAITAATSKPPAAVSRKSRKSRSCWGRVRNIRLLGKQRCFAALNMTAVSAAGSTCGRVPTRRSMPKALPCPRHKRHGRRLQRKPNHVPTAEKLPSVEKATRMSLSQTHFPRPYTTMLSSVDLVPRAVTITIPCASPPPMSLTAEPATPSTYGVIVLPPAVEL